MSVPFNGIYCTAGRFVLGLLRSSRSTTCSYVLHYVQKLTNPSDFKFLHQNGEYLANFRWPTLYYYNKFEFKTIPNSHNMIKANVTQLVYNVARRLIQFDNWSGNSNNNTSKQYRCYWCGLSVYIRDILSGCIVIANFQWIHNRPNYQNLCGRSPRVARQANVSQVGKSVERKVDDLPMAIIGSIYSIRN